MGTILINGTKTTVPDGAVAYKYADPIEDACWIYSMDKAQEIAAEDPSLIVWSIPKIGSRVRFVRVNEELRTYQMAEKDTSHVPCHVPAGTVGTVGAIGKIVGSVDAAHLGLTCVLVDMPRPPDGHVMGHYFWPNELEPA